MVSKTDLAKRVADQMGVSQAKANQMVNTVFDAITDALARGEEVRLTGFGTFRVSQRSARMGRNPRTGQPIQIPAGRRPTFSAGSNLVSAVEGKQVQGRRVA